MNIARWTPLRELSRELDQAFGVFPMPGSFAADNVHDWQPLVDIRETGDAYKVDVELPAVEPKDVHIALKDGVLRVTGERRFVKDEDGGRVHRSERRYGRFTRSFRLPEDADAEAIRATAKDGVVAIAIGKSAQASDRAIEVEVA